ncbi:hypothetical protein SCG7086_AA_00550 [Chlamydiales bacterium SCGC AG-110-P3]|nr:hypothetical protein SCG7086_AA_00550 [Chlamydiales bacterium SCGC AG-110-P3]
MNWHKLLTSTSTATNEEINRLPSTSTTSVGNGNSTSIVTRRQPEDHIIQKLRMLLECLIQQKQNGHRDMFVSIDGAVSVQQTDKYIASQAGGEVDFLIAWLWMQNQSCDMTICRNLGNQIDTLLHLRDRQAAKMDKLCRCILGCSCMPTIYKRDMDLRLSERTRCLVATYVIPSRKKFHQQSNALEGRSHTLLDGALKITVTAKEILFHKGCLGTGACKKAIELENFDTFESSVFLQIKPTLSLQQLEVAKTQMASEYRLLQQFKGKEGIAQLSEIKLADPDSPLEGSTGFIMKYYNKSDLRSFLKISHSSVTKKQKHEICRQIASGLHAMHSAGVYHGDLKLSNIFLSLDPNDQSIKVGIGDFGFARTSPCIKENRGFTINYVAPELVIYKLDMADPNSTKDDSPPPSATTRLSQPAAKMDIWALGVTFFIIWLNKHPYSEQIQTQETNATKEHQKRSYLLNLSKMTTRDWQRKNTNIGLLAQNDRIHGLISEMLAPNPADRPDISQILERLMNEDSPNISSDRVSLTDSSNHPNSIEHIQCKNAEEGGLKNDNPHESNTKSSRLADRVPSLPELYIPRRQLEQHSAPADNEQPLNSSVSSLPSNSSLVLSESPCSSDSDSAI